MPSILKVVACCGALEHGKEIKLQCATFHLSIIHLIQR